MAEENGPFRVTTKDDPRAELRYVRKPSSLEKQLSCINSYTIDGVYQLEDLFKQVSKHPLYKRFIETFGLKEFGYNDNPKRELELWDAWHYEQTGEEWLGQAFGVPQKF